MSVVDKANPYRRFKENSFTERFLIAKAPAPWYKMTPSQVFTHNIGPGIYNDLVRQFFSRAGLGFMLGIAHYSHENPMMSLAHQTANIVGGRIGIAFGGSMGGSMGIKASKALGKLVTGSAEGVLTNPLRLGGTIAGGLVGMFAASMIADAAVGVGQSMVEQGQHLLAPDLGYGFQQTRGAVTARQRSLLAMKTSRFNTRSVLGNEAFRLATGF